jgi:6-phospho-3-hexuloisomerase
LVASGSGESIIPVQIALKAKELGANIALITAASASTLKSIADITLHLSAPTKKSTNEGAKSIQPMSTLFDQSLHIAGDIIVLLIADIINCKTDTLWQYHANLE